MSLCTQDQAVDYTLSSIRQAEDALNELWMKQGSWKVVSPEGVVVTIQSTSKRRLFRLQSGKGKVVSVVTFRAAACLLYIHRHSVIYRQGDIIKDE